MPDADAEVDGIMSVYLIKTFNSGFLVKVGHATADITTKENLSTGTVYGNSSIDGVTYGFGWAKESDNGVFLRTTVEHTDYDAITLNGGLDSDSVRNVIKADVDVTTAKISLGKSF